MSTELTTEMMNEAIAIFMGGSSIKEHGGKRYVYYLKSCAKDVSGLKYHTSWDWLWPVWVKFRALSFTEKFRRWNHERHKGSIAKSLCDGTIEEVHRYLYRGVVWYQKVNQQKQTNGSSSEP